MGSKKKVTIGFKYYMGLDMKICHGPVDQVGPVYAGERLVEGVLATYDRVSDPSIQQVNATSPDLFGGEKKEGGIEGAIDIMFGANDQAQNDYLLSQPEMNATNLPGFRGVVSLICRKIYIAAMSPYPKPWAVTITDIPQRLWYPETAVIKQIGDEFDGANAAHIVVDTLTNSDWGLGYSFGRIDEDSFRTVADTLLAEGLSLSMLLSKQDAIDSFLQQVMKHVNGVLYTDRVTGAFVFKLYRDDYDPETLTEFDENNIIKLNSYQRPAYGEMVNEIVLIYRKRGQLKDSAITFQDLSSVQAQGGIISQTVQYPGIDDPDRASEIGVRELRQNSTPLAQVQITVNRHGNELNPGDVFKFSWAEYGITSMVLRVLKVDYGDLQSRTITIDAMEDLFALGTSKYTTPQPSIWADPVAPPVVAAANLLTEVPYLDLVTFFADDTGGLEALTPSDTYVTYLAKEPSSKGPGFELWDKLSVLPDYIFQANGVYAAVPTINQDMSEFDEVIDVQNLDTFDTADFVVGTYGILGEEIVRIDEINYGAQTITMGRGCLDTTPEKHTVDDLLWLGEDQWAFDGTQWQTGNTIDAKALTQTGQGVLDIDTIGIQVQSLTLVGRQNKPYPPGKVQFDSVAVGTNTSFPESVQNNTPGGKSASDINWVNRNRISQTVPGLIFDFFAANITAEANTTYEVRYFSEFDLLDPDGQESKLYAGIFDATLNEQDWDTEAADTPTLYEVNPLDHHVLNMPFYNNEIGGTLSPESVAQNVINTTFGQGSAVMSAGGFDIGLFSLPAIGGISFSFVAEETGVGDDLQTLIGKSHIGGQTGLAIHYNKASQKLAYSREADSFIDMPYPIVPGVSYSVLLWVNGSGGIIYINGISSASFNPSIIWTGLPWTIGSRYTAASPLVRVNLFRGSMKDLRIYDGLVSLVDYRAENLRISKVFRTKVTTIRTDDAVDYDSFQSYDYTVRRIGWGIGWGSNWTGRVS